MKNKIIFGTDGWRGIIDDDVNEDSMTETALAFSEYMKSKKGSKPKRVAAGFDGRKNSALYADIFSEVLSGNGIEVLLSGNIIPTPVLSYYAKINNLDSGVMITASHNPPAYNGVKFKASYGGPFLTEQTLEVERYLSGRTTGRNRRYITITNFLPEYIRQINSIIDFEVIKKSGIKILIDSMSGAGQKIIGDILKRHNIETVTIFGEANEDFSGRQAEPIEKNLIPLSNGLKSGNYSLGIATDGDADRIGVMLESGEWLSAQETILLISDYLCNIKKIPGNIVKTSSVTDKLRHLESAGRKVLDVQVGFKYICEEMIKGDIVFGCEESGGFGYGFHIPERDGILSGLLLCEILASSGFVKLSDAVNSLRKKYGRIYYLRQDLPYHKDDRISLHPQMFRNPPSSINGIKVKRIKEFLSSHGIINGIKFSLEGKSRWLLIRSSETEPLIRVYVEAENEEETDGILGSGINLIMDNQHK